MKRMNRDSLKVRAARKVTTRVDLPLAGVRADWEALAYNGDLMVVRGRKRFEVGETLYGTSYWGELEPTVLQALGFLLAPTGKLVRRSSIIGDMTVSEYEAQGGRDQELSLDAAALAAGAYLGVPGNVYGKGCHVEGVNPDGPNAGKLSPGDVITHVDGESVSTLPELLETIEGKETFTVTVTTLQDGSERPLHLETTLERDDEGHLGLLVSTHRQHISPSLDVTVHFPPDMGGPSTGLVLALSILDVLTPGSLTGGEKVACTGAIGPDGEVIEIGGADYKAHTVNEGKFKLFLVPTNNVDEARSVAGEGVEVVGVDTLAQAVEILVARGGDRPVLPT